MCDFCGDTCYFRHQIVFGLSIRGARGWGGWHSVSVSVATAMNFFFCTRNKVHHVISSSSGITHHTRNRGWLCPLSCIHCENTIKAHNRCHIAYICMCVSAPHRRRMTPPTDTQNALRTNRPKRRDDQRPYSMLDYLKLRSQLPVRYYIIDIYCGQTTQHTKRPSIMHNSTFFSDPLG